MPLWPFGKKKDDDMSVETLLEQSNAASPTGSVVPSPPGPVATGSFLLPVEDVFFITGRGVVATGRIESGTGQVGMQVEVVRGGNVVLTTTITGIEMFRKVVHTANAGDNIGLLLKGVSKDQVLRGDVIQA